MFLHLVFPQWSGWNLHKRKERFSRLPLGRGEDQRSHRLWGNLLILSMIILSMIIIRIIVFKSLTFFDRGGFIQETLVARTKMGSSMSAVGWRRSSLQVSFLSANVNDIFVEIMSNIWKHIFPRWRWKCGSGSHWRRHQSRTGWSCQPSHAGGHIFFKNLPWSTIGFKKMFLSTIGSKKKMAIYCPQGSGTLRQQLLMMHWLCHSMPEHARVCQSMPEYARVCQSMPLYARVCNIMPEYARDCQSMP